MGIFSNLFRGEMLEKTLHYYFLTPMRREMLVAGKYLAGLVVAITVPAEAYRIIRKDNEAMLVKLSKALASLPE